MLAEPSIMNVVLEILLKYEQEGYVIRRLDLKNTLYLILDYHCVHGNIYEILWVLWFAKSFSIKLSQTYGNQLVKIDNPMVAIMVKYLQDDGLISKNLNNSVWSEHERKEDLYSNYWLYTYEAKQRGWMNPSNSFHISCNFYKALETYNISFFNPNKQIAIEPFIEFDDEKMVHLQKSIKIIKDLIGSGTVSDSELKDLEKAVSESIEAISSDMDY